MSTSLQVTQFLFAKRSKVILIVFIMLTGFSNVCVFAQKERQDNSQKQKHDVMAVLHAYIDTTLSQGADHYGEVHSPLLADGIHTKTKEPVRWEFTNDNWIISNFGSQQNLLRFMVGYSELTGDEKYVKRAAEIVQYMFDKYTDKNGLLYWGGHQFVDLESMQTQFKERPHELKTHFPLYEFMWEVDSTATKRLLEAIWNAHVLDWSVLDLNRHGEYNSDFGKLWEQDFHQPEPFFESEGLTFINAGTDMVHVAMNVYALSGDEQAREWGERLYYQYVRARHPETGLGVYQYSKPVREENPPKTGPLTGRLTYSSYGDRAENQFGFVYGDVAKEGNMLWGGRMQTLYGQSPVLMLHLAKQLQKKSPEMSQKFTDWTVQGLKSYVKYAYKPKQNRFIPMWADGTDLSGETMPRTGYFGDKGEPFPEFEPDGTVLLAYVKAIRLAGFDTDLWNLIRYYFIEEHLGDPGEDDTNNPNLNLETSEDNPAVLVAILELYEATKNKTYLALAERIGQNIIDQHFFDGYFKESKDHLYTKFDSPEALSLLMLEATKRGVLHEIPPYLTGEGSTDGNAVVPGYDGRPKDDMIYKKKRNVKE